MFDPLVAERVAADVRLLSELDLSTCSTAEVEQLVRTSQACTQTLAGVQARAGAEFEARGGPEQAGCSTLGAWLRRELRLSPAQALRARRAGSALRQLPLVRQALTAGSITMEHVDVFADSTRRIGVPVVRDAQQLLLGVAVHSDTRDLRTAVDRLRDAVDPDAADRDWANAQEKQDLTCHRVGSGWQVAGWLSVETGAKLRVLLDSFGKPAHAEDDRPVARRRVDALDALLDDILAGGLPTDHGVRPHLNVTVDADTLAAAFGAATSSGHTSGAGDGSTRPGATRPAATRPATLAGYGAIGRDLLTMLACDSTITVALTDGHTDQHPGIRTGIGPPHRHQPDVHPPGTNPPGGLSGDSPPGAGPPGADRWELGRHHCGCPTTPYRHVLDVGRSERIATARQRLAVLIAQDHRCATPGCQHTALQIHHIVPWLLGGPTNMDNLIGLCLSCHTLLHRGLLTCTADGHGGALFHRSDGTHIPDTPRHINRQFEHHLDEHLQHQQTEGTDAA